VAEPSRLQVYRRLLGAQVRSQTAYHTSFLLDLASNGLFPLIDLFSILVLFRVTRALAGFGVDQVLVMYGLSATGFAAADLVVGNIERIRLYVRQGLLDTVLIRPLSVLGQLVTADFTLRRASRVLLAAGVLGVAVTREHGPWTPARIALLGIAPVAGAVFFGALFVAGATVAFWWIESGELANAFTYGGRDFTAYPITVYSGFFRRAFAYSLGFAFVGYYPALALLAEPDPLGLPAWVGWTCPAVALVAAGVAATVWRTGVRHYRSTGS
jgi:viologen exporter family transport system permease protein